MAKIDWSLDLERYTACPTFWLDEWVTISKPRVRPPVFRVPEVAMKQQEWRYLFWSEQPECEGGVPWAQVAVFS